MTEIERAYRALFLTADGSALKPEGEVVLRDLEKKCDWMNVTLPIDNHGTTDPYRMAGMHARRSVFSHIKQRIFAVKGDTNVRGNNTSG